MSEPILEITKLNKSFGPVHVLHDVDLIVFAGEVTALVGDNGAGKSTLVKCIAGINGIDSGEVKWEGSPVNITDPRVATSLGIQFQPQYTPLVFA
ncbi:MAG: ATP-binding cassette domain-containing protein, partial [Marmoricola sp.]